MRSQKPKNWISKTQNEGLKKLHQEQWRRVQPKAEPDEFRVTIRDSEKGDLVGFDVSNPGFFQYKYCKLF